MDLYMLYLEEMCNNKIQKVTVIANYLAMKYTKKKQQKNYVCMFVWSLLHFA